CACVASSWSKYLNQFFKDSLGPEWMVPTFLMHDPFTGDPGTWFNLPAALITIGCTIILVIGIRESATMNAILVGIKVGVVLFVIAVGLMFINPANWTSIPVTERLMPQESLILKNAADIIAKEEKLSGKALEARVKQMKVQAIAQFRVSQNPDKLEQYQDKLPQTPEDKAMVGMLLDFAE